MIDALDGDANRLGAGEDGDLLRWFLAGNLTQLGHEIRARNGSQTRAKGICTFTDEPLLAEGTIAAIFDWCDRGGDRLLILKSNRVSRIHRAVLVDLFIVPIVEKGKVTSLSIHAGLWTRCGARRTLRAGADPARHSSSSLMARFGYNPSGHAAKALAHVLTHLPHDILLALPDASRERLALTAMSLADRPRPKIELVADSLGRHLFAFAWLLRDDVSTARREAIEEMLIDAANAPLLGWSMALEDSGLALIRFTIDLRGDGYMPDGAALDMQLGTMLRGWLPAVEAALTDLGEGARAAVLAERFANGFPMVYRNGAGPDEAALDISGIASGSPGRGRAACASTAIPRMARRGCASRSPAARPWSSPRRCRRSRISASARSRN